MSKRTKKQPKLYSYEVTITPPEQDFNSRNLRPTVAKVFIRKVISKEEAVNDFLLLHFPTLRRNGIIRGVKQALACMTVRRMTSHRA